MKAIATLKKGEGPDNIPAEAIKADKKTTVTILHNLFSKIWEKGELPTAQWKEGLVIKLPTTKEQRTQELPRHHALILLTVLGKVLNIVLLKRMKEAVDPQAS
jgi:hypothetical protein